MPALDGLGGVDAPVHHRLLEETAR